jgi:outer membrane beta-barrel protein
VGTKIQLFRTACSLTLMACLSLLIDSRSVFAGVGGYKKATEGEDVIKNKLYPKKNRVELNGPNLGLILNQSYIDTYLINGGINYFWSESWGMGAEITFALNKDRYERDCIESFYNDVDYEIPEECGGPDKIQDADADAGPNNPSGLGNYGPAYVNIREYNMLLTGNAIWNPIYGKEIFFLSGVVNFDVFVTMGGGLAMTTFYPLQTFLNNGNESRGNFPAPGNTTAKRPGAEPDETDSYGKAGRPAPTKESKVFLEAGIGQKIHINKTLNFKAELRNHIVLGTPGGFDLFFALWAGVGARF